MKKIKRFFILFLKFNLILFFLGLFATLVVPFFGKSCNNNTPMERFDLIIILGSPANENCEPGFIMKNRVKKGIELFRSGLGKKILFTGSSVRNSCTEAEVMAAYANLNGVPNIAILIETKAKNTFENAYYSIQKMSQFNFKSAAIVTSEPHIKRACTIFAKYNIDYTMIPAKLPSDISGLQLFFWNFGERMILTHYILFGYPKIT